MDEKSASVGLLQVSDCNHKGDDNMVAVESQSPIKRKMSTSNKDMDTSDTEDDQNQNRVRFLNFF